MDADTVVKNLKKLAKELNTDLLTQKQIRTIPKLEYYAAFNFGSLRKAVIASGLKTRNQERKMTKEEVKDALIEISQRKNGENIKLSDIRKIPGLERYMYRYYHTVVDALEDLHLKPTDHAIKMQTKNDKLLEYLRKLTKKLNKKPTVLDIKREEEYSERIFIDRFGSVPKAVELALKTADKITENHSKQIIEYGPLNQSELNRYRGKAGETLVAAELLYRGYNSNIMAVDEGVDVIAVKNKQTFYFQVKNVSLLNSTTRSISITASSYKTNQQSNVFYIFILQGLENKDFLIIPYFKFEELIREGLVKTNEKDYVITLKTTLTESAIVSNVVVIKDGKSINVSSYLNEWSVIV